MRTQKTILNLVYALGSSLLLMLLGFATRRLLVFNFGNDITAASQVVDKLFNFFSIAEFGVGSVISYRLYEQIAAKDTEKISKYMSMYKWAYRAVGVVICVLAGIGALALPWIMPGVASIQTAYTVYLLNTISTLSGYFLVTRRLMYTCTQQGYLCTRIDFCFNVANYLARIAIALWLPNYILYFKDLGIFHDLKYYLVHRLSNTIYGSSDTIVTSRMAGSAMTANLGNYTTVSDSATNIGNKIMDSFAAAIGNIVYDKSATANAHDKQVFWGLDLFSYFFGSFVATAYLCLFQPFISLWMGSDRLLPLGFVIVFSLNEYVGWNHRMLGSYRAVLGHFEQDQWFMVASAATNLILSFALFPAFGITGIVAATVVAHCIMWVGRGIVVCRQYMRGSGWRYLRVQAVHLVTLVVLMAGSYRVCALLPGGILGLLGRAVVVCIMPNLLNLAFYIWTSDAAYLRTQAGRLWQKITHR